LLLRLLPTSPPLGPRRSMGTGVVGGMLAATFIATIFIPLFFTVVARRKKDKRTPRPSATHAPAE
jgi:multidrug efflux pump